MKITIVINMPYEKYIYIGKLRGEAYVLL